jgi:hypothetical protein
VTIRICEICNKEFLRPGRKPVGKHVFCSRECYHKAISTMLRPASRVNCLVCGKEIKRQKSHHSSKNFCSMKCMGIERRNQLQLVCEFCQKPIIRRQSEIKHKHVFCSHKCYLKFKHREGYVILKCKLCKKTFKKRLSCMDSQNHFCSRKCCNVWKGRHKTSYRIYKQLAQWKHLNLGEVCSRKEKSMLKKVGIFCPRTRKGGMSRDHKFSVFNGFVNNVFPQLIGHPANCSLILQSANAKKHIKNSITLSQLFDDILAYQKPYKDQKLCIDLITEYLAEHRWKRTTKEDCIDNKTLHM